MKKRYLAYVVCPLLVIGIFIFTIFMPKEATAEEKALLQENILYSNSTILGEGDNFLRVKNAKSAKIKMANKQGDMDTLREVYFDKDGSVNTLTIYGQDHKVVQSIQKTNRGWTSETRNYLTDETGRIIISHGINGDTTHFFYNKKNQIIRSKSKKVASTFSYDSDGHLVEIVRTASYSSMYGDEEEKNRVQFFYQEGTLSKQVVTTTYGSDANPISVSLTETPLSSDQYGNWLSIESIVEQSNQPSTRPVSMAYDIAYW